MMKKTIIVFVIATSLVYQLANGLLLGFGLGGLGIGGIGLGGGLLGGIGLHIPITGCRCLAVEESNHGIVLRDFGIIQACGPFTLCGCGELQVKSCRKVCDSVVELWASNNCPLVLRHTEVRALFQSQLCSNGLGESTHDCDGTGLLPLLSLGLPNLIL